MTRHVVCRIWHSMSKCKLRSPSMRFTGCLRDASRLAEHAAALMAYAGCSIASMCREMGRTACCRLGVPVAAGSQPKRVCVCRTTWRRCCGRA